MHVKIFGVVIVIKFLTGFDMSLGKDVNLSVAYIYFAIRYARVIDESSFIFRDISVYHRVPTRPEEILPSVRFLLGFRNRSPFVFNDACASRYALFGKHAEAGI